MHTWSVAWQPPAAAVPSAYPDRSIVVDELAVVDLASGDLGRDVARDDLDLEAIEGQVAGALDDQPPGLGGRVWSMTRRVEASTPDRELGVGVAVTLPSSDGASGGRRLEAGKERARRGDGRGLGGGRGAVATAALYGARADGDAAQAATTIRANDATARGARRRVMGPLDRAMAGGCGQGFDA